MAVFMHEPVSESLSEVRAARVGRRARLERAAALLSLALPRAVQRGTSTGAGTGDGGMGDAVTDVVVKAVELRFGASDSSSHSASA